MRQSGSKSILGEQMREFFATGWEEVIRSIDSSEWLLLGRTILAALIGGLLGWEREAQGKDAGLRTHILVCIASALFAGVSLMVAKQMSPSADPLRAVPAIATGIGFLGAGMIFVNRRHKNVHGLTTAASIWATAAIGMTVGFGYWLLASGACLLVWIALRLLNRIAPSSGDHHLNVTNGFSGTDAGELENGCEQTSEADSQLKKKRSTGKVIDVEGPGSFEVGQ